MTSLLGESFSFIFRKKVAGSVDRHGGMAWGSGDEPLERALAAGGYGIAVAKRSEQRLGPALKNFPCGAICFPGRIAGTNPPQQRKLSCAPLLTIVTNRPVLGAHFFSRRFSPATPLH